MVFAYQKCEKCDSWGTQIIVGKTTFCEKCEFVMFMKAKYDYPLEDSSEPSKIKRPSQGEI